MITEHDVEVHWPVELYARYTFLSSRLLDFCHHQITIKYKRTVLQVNIFTQNLPRIISVTNSNLGSKMWVSRDLENNEVMTVHSRIVVDAGNRHTSLFNVYLSVETIDVGYIYIYPTSMVETCLPWRRCLVCLRPGLRPWIFSTSLTKGGRLAVYTFLSFSTLSSSSLSTPANHNHNTVKPVLLVCPYFASQTKPQN